MSSLPPDLPWRDFVRVLTRLGYKLYKSGPAQRGHFITSIETQSSPPSTSRTERAEYAREL
jgi:hypothetical protein